MNSSNKIIEIFKKTQSIKAAAKQVGYSWNRIAKALSTRGFVIPFIFPFKLDK